MPLPLLWFTHAQTFWADISTNHINVHTGDVHQARPHYRQWWFRGNYQARVQYLLLHSIKNVGMEEPSVLPDCLQSWPDAAAWLDRESGLSSMTKTLRLLGTKIIMQLLMKSYKATKESRQKQKRDRKCWSRVAGTMLYRERSLAQIIQILHWLQAKVRFG